MNLSRLKEVFSAHGCERIFVKELSPNDNSKNQVYLAGSFDVLNIFPVSDITSEDPGDWKRSRFKAQMKFSWINDDGNTYPAPNAQLILYPKYPEVRFSGFLQGCNNAPSEILTTRDPGRLLCLAVNREGRVLGYAAGESSEVAREFQNASIAGEHGLFKILSLRDVTGNKTALLSELKRIHEKGWIKAKQLKSDGSLAPCASTNCGGMTLEAELGITPNGYSQPDYLGWEIKQFTVKQFHLTESKVVTLMTPQPTGGIYRKIGAKKFVKQYGYPDKKGRSDRVNMGGIYRAGGDFHKDTGLRLKVDGFNADTGKIESSNGSVVLLDKFDNVAISWSFAHLLKNWNKKHNQACYVTSMLKKNGIQKYHYGNKVLLGEGTGFNLFLQQIAIGNIHYDPGIKLENASTEKPRVKQRSQFRMKSGNLRGLYYKTEEVDVGENLKLNL